MPATPFANSCWPARPWSITATTTWTTYDDWLEVAIAQKNLPDDEAAIVLWDDWGSASGKYDDNLTADNSESLRLADAAGRIRLGTLFRRAMDEGWPGPAFVDSEDGRGVRRITYRSGRKEVICVPARTIEKAE